jgi:hypothetical protein
MATAPASGSPTADRQWRIVGRWEEYEGEGRANLLRLIAVTAFYAIELAHYHGLQFGFFEIPGGGATRSFHIAVTMLVVVWAMLCLGISLARKQGYFPASLKFLSTGCDLVLLTSVLALGEGSKSPLVLGFFIIQMLAALRFSLPLVWFASLGSAACYVFLLGYAVWMEPSQRVPRYQQLLVLVGLALSGVILGQVIRRVKHLAHDYARRLDANRGGTP